MGITQTNSNGILRPGLGSIHTRNYPYPSGEITVSVNSTNERYVTHHGQVRPNSMVTFKYVSYASGTAVYRLVHQMGPSRDNGVLSQQPEAGYFSWGIVGERLTVYADFETRSCGQIHHAPLGDIVIGP